MKASTAVTWLTALSAMASKAFSAASSGTVADTRLPATTELESAGRRDLVNLGRNSIGLRKREVPKAKN